MARTARTEVAEQEIPFTVANRTPITTVCPQTGQTAEVRGITWEELNASGLLAEEVDTANPPEIGVYSRQVRYRLLNPSRPLTEEQKAAQRERNRARQAKINRGLELLKLVESGMSLEDAAAQLDANESDGDHTEAEND